MVSPGGRWLATALCLGAAALGCSAPQNDRRAAIAGALTAADRELATSRPLLVAGKYRRMAASLYDYLRGSFPLFLRDATDGATGLAASDFWLDGALVLGMGDAHLENFGLLRASDGSFALEANDFDAADAYPYLWELRRLASSLVVAGRVASPPLADAAPVAREAARAYATTLDALSGGGVAQRLSDPGDGVILADLFERAESAAASRDELAALTTFDGSARRLRRGVLDEPSHVLLDLPAWVWAQLPAALSRYTASLLTARATEFFTILDAARELGTGVASWPRVRALVLVEGLSTAPEDDVVLEWKELGDSGAGGWLPPGVLFDDVGARVVGAAHASWFTPAAEPLWGATALGGFRFQVRERSEAYKTLRARRLEAERAGETALQSLAATLGGLLARMHHASSSAVAGAVARRIADAPEMFADEQAAAAVAYAATIASDWLEFQAAIEERGPLLGAVLDGTPPSPDLQALYAAPP